MVLYIIFKSQKKFTLQIYFFQGLTPKLDKKVTKAIMILIKSNFIS